MGTVMSVQSLWTQGSGRGAQHPPIFQKVLEAHLSLQTLRARTWLHIKRLVLPTALLCRPSAAKRGIPVHRSMAAASARKTMHTMHASVRHTCESAIV